MKTQSLHRGSPTPASSLISSPTSLPFARRFTSAAAARALFPAPPLGRLIDPHFLDRLQAPLTRYRD